MKFYRNQKVVCIGNPNEWDYVVPNFDEQLKIALKVNKIPKKDEVYVVSQPMALHYKNKCYIELVGFDQNIFDENGFKPVDELELVEHNKSAVKKAMKIIHTNN